MTPQQAAYRAGCIVSEINARIKPLTDVAISNASRMPNKLHVVLRHVWGHASQVPEIADLMEDFDPPNVAYSPVIQGPFWMGFYHQNAVRDLPGGFGERLKALIEQVGISSTELADKSGLTRQAVHKLLNGSLPSWDTVQRLADALGVSPDVMRDRK